MRDSAGHSWPGPADAAVRAGVLAAGLLGALLLVVAEFTTLFQVHTAASAGPVRSVSTGSHHSYALIPIALLAAALAVAVFKLGSRPALLSIGLLGVAALLIAFLGDLPDASALGLVGSAATHYVNATSTPSAGIYMETMGAAVLIIASGAAFLLLWPSNRQARRRDPEWSGGGS
jgi:hypothetical protein